MASNFVSSEVVQRLDELSQISLNGLIEPTENISELNEADELILAELGRFGHLNDQFNEQIDSVDYLPVLTLETPIGNLKVSDILEWVIS